MLEADDSRWAAFNTRQAGRPTRPLLVDLLRRAGPGDGRMAVELGCGAGLEARALLDAGWRVLAIDSEPDTAERVTRTIGGTHPRLTVEVRGFDDIADLPATDLVYSGYALPYQKLGSFDRLWTVIRASLRAGGWIGVNVFGVRDSWAGTDGMTFLDEAAARELMDGLEIASWYEEDEDGMAFDEPKHWHVFDVIAQVRA